EATEPSAAWMPHMTAASLAAALLAVGWTLLAPLGCLAVGYVVLRRQLAPLADVECQLRSIALEDAEQNIQLAPVQVHDAMTRGWNRLAHELDRRTTSSLEARAADALQSRRGGRLAELLHSMSDGIAATDRNGRLTFANQAFGGLLGRTEGPDQLAGKPIEKLLGVNADESACHPLWSTECRERAVVAELVRQAEATERVLRVARLPLRSAGGGHVWSIRDITQ